MWLVRLESSKFIYFLFSRKKFKADRLKAQARLSVIIRDVQGLNVSFIRLCPFIRFWSVYFLSIRLDSIVRRVQLSSSIKMFLFISSFMWSEYFLPQNKSFSSLAPSYSLTFLHQLDPIVSNHLSDKKFTWRLKNFLKIFLVEKDFSEDIWRNKPDFFNFLCTSVFLTTRSSSQKKTQDRVKASSTSFRPEDVKNEVLNPSLKKVKN